MECSGIATSVIHVVKAEGKNCKPNPRSQFHLTFLESLSGAKRGWCSDQQQQQQQQQQACSPQWYRVVTMMPLPRARTRARTSADLVGRSERRSRSRCAQLSPAHAYHLDSICSRAIIAAGAGGGELTVRPPLISKPFAIASCIRATTIPPFSSVLVCVFTLCLSHYHCMFWSYAIQQLTHHPPIAIRH